MDDLADDPIEEVDDSPLDVELRLADARLQELNRKYVSLRRELQKVCQRMEEWRRFRVRVLEAVELRRLAVVGELDEEDEAPTQVAPVTVR